MTTTKLMVENIRATFDKALAIVAQKNSDYAKEADPFRNLNGASVLGLSMEQAVLVRVLDKITRINNLLTKPPAVTDESLEDSIIDAINYLALLKAKRDLTSTG